MTDPPVTVADHERSDIRIGPLAVFLAGLVVSLIVTGLLVGWLFAALERIARRSDPPEHLRTVEERTPGPLLQVSPQHDMDLLREREVRELASTRWIDRDAGLVQIPIDRAMELVGRDGLPSWPRAAEAAEPKAPDPANPGGESGIETPADPARNPEGNDP